MLILGLDPGFAITGYGLVDSVSNHLSMVKYGAITTPAGMPFTQRLLAIRNELNDIIRKAAKDIHEKYVEPPQTTDFGIMFLPFEGLYAEVRRILDINKEERHLRGGEATKKKYLCLHNKSKKLS